MKGLLRKEFLLLWAHCRVLLLIMAVFLVAAAAGHASAFILAYPVLLAGVVSVTLISYDERSGWNAYSAALPCTRAQLVTAKYALLLCCLACCLLLVGVGQGVRMALAGGVDWRALLTLLGLLAVLGAAAPAILLPIVFRLGAEKGRLAYYLVIIVFCVAATLGGDAVDVLWAISPIRLALPLLLCAVLLLLFSWRLSIRFYRRREL